MLELVEYFYFTDEWSFDIADSICLQRKLTCQNLTLSVDMNFTASVRK